MAELLDVPVVNTFSGTPGVRLCIIGLTKTNRKEVYNMIYDRRSTTPLTLDEATNEYEKVHKSIKDLLYNLGDDCDNIRYDRDDLDEDFLQGQYYYLADQLKKIERRLSYLLKPVTEQGYIRHNAGKRYELPSGTYFTTGSDCEMLVNDTRNDEQYWIHTDIGHNGEDYYATKLGKDVSINGMMVRVRE